MELEVRAWGRILAGYTPALSIEITRECPLRCPGCYAYGDEHLGGGVTLRELRDFRGQELVDRVLALVENHRPVHVSIVGGEPLVRYRELNTILPQLSARGVHVQLVTSAVREIPVGWSRLSRLSIVVSVDGLPPEHDARRAPATYERILKNISGHQITVHCTITRQQATRPDYIEEFVTFWSKQQETKRVWISLYTPQTGEISGERLTRDDRRRIIADLLALRIRYPKLQMTKGTIDAYADPPTSPEECVFARMTATISADLKTTITPCQFGGVPDCANCGCLASAGLNALVRHRFFGVIPLAPLYTGSVRVGDYVRRWRAADSRARAILKRSEG